MKKPENFIKQPDRKTRSSLLKIPTRRFLFSARRLLLSAGCFLPPDLGFLPAGNRRPLTAFRCNVLFIWPLIVMGGRLAARIVMNLWDMIEK